MKPEPRHPLILKREIVFQNQWICVLEKQVETRSGCSPQSFYSLSVPVYIYVIAETEDGKFPLVRQFRPAIEAVTWEFPSGLLEPAEEPLCCAKRELSEETGYNALNIRLLTTFTTDTGRISNRTFVFHCSGCVKSPDWSAQEDIEVCVVTRAELERLIEIEELNFALHLAAWAAYLRIVG